MSELIGTTGLVVRNIPRADAALVNELGRYGVATIHEAQGRKGLLAPRITPIQRGTVISGTAVTVLVAPGDNWMFHVAVEQCQPGDILVVADLSDYSSASGTYTVPATVRLTNGADLGVIGEYQVQARIREASLEEEPAD